MGHAHPKAGPVAFLLIDQVKDGMANLHDNIPDIEDLEELLNYFDHTYVSGTFR